MRAKFYVQKAEKLTNKEGEVGCVMVDFTAIGGNTVNSGYPSDGADEDNNYAKWTPSAHLSMIIQNPNLFNSFEVGDKFYVDFTKEGKTE